MNSYIKYQTKNTKIILLVFIIIFLLGLFGVSSLMQASQGFTVYPAKISLTIEKGQKQVNSISVTNAGDNSVGVKIEVQDIEPTLNSSGYNYLPKAEGITSLVDWVTIDKKVFTLKPGQSKDVPFTIQVPADASAGSRFAVIFFGAGSSGGGQLNVSARVGALVFLTVPGDFRQTGELLNFQVPSFVYAPAPINFKFAFKNTGTVYFEPKGTIAVTNIFGNKVTDIEVAGNVVLPTGLRAIDAVWPDPGWLFGIYKAHLAISVTGKGDLATADAIIYAFPIVPSLGALGVLIILIMLFWYIKKNFKFAIVKK